MRPSAARWRSSRRGGPAAISASRRARSWSLEAARIHHRIHALAELGIVEEGLAHAVRVHLAAVELVDPEVDARLVAAAPQERVVHVGHVLRVVALAVVVFGIEDERGRD